MAVAARRQEPSSRPLPLLCVLKATSRSYPRPASSDRVNASRFPSFEARARVGSAGAACTPALLNTGTPPNFVSAKLAQEIVQAGTGMRVPVHVRISAAGVFRGECREALRTQVWFKVRGAWKAHVVDLLIFETGQPIIIGYLDLLPSRYKGGWPQRAAARRVERAQAAAMTSTRHGSALC